MMHGPRRKPAPDPASPPPRYLPDEPLPPYTYISGYFPHPTRDPAGHSYHKPTPTPAPPDPAHWRACRPYLLGIDLFNHGYYWEAHEAWESLWRASGRTGVTGVFLKGLIKLAAAGIKVRQGQPRGVRVHAQHAAAHFGAVRERIRGQGDRYMGLSLCALIEAAQKIAEEAGHLQGHPARPVEIVLPLVLRPS